MSRIILRDYQDSSIRHVRAMLRKYQSVLLQLPTGAGKTACAAYMAFSSQERGNIVFFICHRAELLNQTAQTFHKAGIRFGTISARHQFHPGHTVYICTLETLRRRIKNPLIPTPSVVFWDEAHHCGAKTWAALKQHYASAFHVGLSATPHRLDGRGLGEHFDAMVRGPTVDDLIKTGHLSGYDLYAPSVPDMTGVHKRAGDFARGESEAVMESGTIVGNIVGNWKRYAKGKRTIGFAVSVKHSMHMVEAFRNAGIAAAHLDGKASDSERALTARKFANGDITVLWNVDLFGEGYDLAAQAGVPVTVDAVIQARPTASLSLHLQQVGRALRPKQDGSRAVILDHAGNAMRHGLPDDDREWSLDGSKGSKSSASKTEVPIRACPECFHVHKPMPRCPKCGHAYVADGRKVEEVEGELTKIDKEAMRKAAKKEQASTRTLDDLVELGRKRGYKNPHAWAAHVFTARKRKSLTV